MIKRIKSNYPKYKFIITGDGLYATTPIINICKKYHWFFIFNLKPDRLKEVSANLLKSLTSTISDLNNIETNIQLRLDD